jgi:Uri superfamily endonuclease
MKGVYVLLMHVDNSTINVGSLGLIQFKEGLYAYVGSAMNSLESRVSRHVSKIKRLHWHIDYLTTSIFVRILNVVYALNERAECKISIHLINKAEYYIDRFGSSDCLCNSHLYKVSSMDDILYAFNKAGLDANTYTL